VPLLAILPGLLALLGMRDDRWIGLPLVVALMLAYGAAITSMGLALATWIPQIGRVLALCVGAVVFVTIGMIFVAILLFGNDISGAGFAMVSPFMGIGFFTAVIHGDGGPNNFWPEAAAWVFIWIVVYSAVAGFLLYATLATFDRCLGRISDPASPPGIPPWAKVRRKPAPVILEEV
jgi:hypothetical protein